MSGKLSILAIESPSRSKETVWKHFQKNVLCWTACECRSVLFCVPFPPLNVFSLWCWIHSGACVAAGWHPVWGTHMIVAVSQRCLRCSRDLRHPLGENLIVYHCIRCHSCLRSHFIQEVCGALWCHTEGSCKHVQRWCDAVFLPWAYRFRVNAHLSLVCHRWENIWQCRCCLRRCFFVIDLWTCLPVYFIHLHEMDHLSTISIMQNNVCF